MEDDLSKFFSLTKGFKQGCVTLPRLFTVCMDGIMKAIQGRVVNEGTPLMRNGRFGVVLCLQVLLPDRANII